MSRKLPAASAKRRAEKGRLSPEEAVDREAVEVIARAINQPVEPPEPEKPKKEKTKKATPRK